jgi:hypothetical protein
MRNLCGSVVIFLRTLQTKYGKGANRDLINEQDIAGLERIREAAAAAGFPLVIRDV